MGVADYYQRSAVAAAQIIAGFDEAAFRAKLDSHHVALALGGDATTRSGRALTEMLVRLLARLYPAMSLSARGRTASLADEMRGLAKAINPNIELDPGAAPTLGVGVGRARPIGRHTVYVGSSGWDALLDTAAPQSIVGPPNPFGAGAAACLAAANLFRAVFLDGVPAERDVVFSTLLREARSTPVDRRRLKSIEGTTVLVGAGAIGNAAAWALARSEVAGRLDVVDPQLLELSNVQRYVVAKRADEGLSKAPLLRDRLGHGRLELVPHEMEWTAFVEEHGYEWRHALVALDSAAGRREVQASLPEWIANAWTQPEDLGISLHSFGDGACLSCLYLPDVNARNEDEIYASALGVPDRLLEVRSLLAYDMPLGEEFLMAVATALGVDPVPVLAYVGDSIRRLYVEGLCGGGIVPMTTLYAPHHDMHVPLAHQSAMAGILLAASLMAKLLGVEPSKSRITRLDLRRGTPPFATQPVAADPRGVCICQDVTFRESYRRKYP